MGPPNAPGPAGIEPADDPVLARLTLLERTIMVSLAVVVVLVTGSIWLTGLLTSPVLAAMDAVNSLDVHLLRSHLALEERAGGDTEDLSPLAELAAAQRLCDEVLADFAIEHPFAGDVAHPCHGLDDLRELTDHELGPHQETATAHRHAEYEAMMAAVVAGAEALDLSVASALTRAQGWVRLVQLLTAGFLFALVVLIAVSARAHSRYNDRRNAQLRWQATHDPLTGLLNRLALRRLLDQAAQEQRVVGVVFLDLDGFKKVNDTAGHARGDQLLVAVAERLRAMVRGHGTAVRLGGDEFAVVCTDADEATALAVADRVVSGLRRPLLVDGHAMAVTASAGVSSNVDDPTDGADLKRHADIAMYIAKARGGDRAETYRPEMHVEIVERIQLAEDLAIAVAENRIDVSYQPIVDAVTGRIACFEALARWSHPTRGPIPPGVFIGVAEQAGLIGALGQQVLDRACGQLRRWKLTHPTARDLSVAVNVSTAQLAADGFVQTVQATLDRNGLAAAHLVLEVTEGALAGTHADAEDVLAELRATGVRIAVDDFGTGHSSLSRLRHLRVHKLKIDRSFVAPIGNDPSAEPLVQSILALGSSLGLEVVAEGVETPEQLAFLAAHGCAYVQGYLLSKPRPPADCDELFADGVPFPVRTLAPLPGRALLPLGALASGNGHSETTGVARPQPPTHRVLAGVLAKLTALTGLEAAYLTRIDRGEGIQHVEAAHNTGDVLITPGLQVPWDETICNRMLTTGPAATTDAPADYSAVPAVQQLQLQTYIGVPVVDDSGDIYGTLCAASRQRIPLADTALITMEVFAAIISAHLDEQMSNGPPDHHQPSPTPSTARERHPVLPADLPEARTSPA